ncbi:MAG TPA: hypothetical protein VGR71_15725, partial [Nitrospira sp.]|nr:hypothetical protein [Nitrospira sp.]
MISRSHRDSSQLTKTTSRRQFAAYGFVGLIALTTVAANLVSYNVTKAKADNVTEVIYLSIAVIVLSSLDVRIERGRLSLSGIALGTAALLLNPVDATLVGLSLGIPMARRGRWAVSANSVMAAAYVCLGAILAAHLRTAGVLNIQSRV